MTWKDKSKNNLIVFFVLLTSISIFILEREKLSSYFSRNFSTFLAVLILPLGYLWTNWLMYLHEMRSYNYAMVEKIIELEKECSAPEKDIVQVCCASPSPKKDEARLYYYASCGFKASAFAYSVAVQLTLIYVAFMISFHIFCNVLWDEIFFYLTLISLVFIFLIYYLNKRRDFPGLFKYIIKITSFFPLIGSKKLIFRPEIRKIIEKHREWLKEGHIKFDQTEKFIWELEAFYQKKGCKRAYYVLFFCVLISAIYGPILCQLNFPNFFKDVRSFDYMKDMAIIVVNIVIACFILSQVLAAKIANKQRVMPILGITWEVPEPKNNEEKNPLCNSSRRKVSELEYANLIIYVRNAIALNIEWEIHKNHSHFWKSKKPKPSAVPYLKEDSRLTIEGKEILKDIKKLKDGEDLIFKAFFTYESILNDNYESEYTLIFRKTGQDILKEENNVFKKRPWDSLIYRLFA